MARIITTRELKVNEYMEFPIFTMNEEVLIVDPQHPEFDKYKTQAQLVKKALEDRLKKLKAEVQVKYNNILVVG